MQHRLVFDKKVLNIVDDCEILFGLLVCMSLSRKNFFFSRRDRGSRSRRVNRRRWGWPTTARHRAAGRYRLPHRAASAVLSQLRTKLRGQNIERDGKTAAPLTVTFYETGRSYGDVSANPRLERGPGSALL